MSKYFNKEIFAKRLLETMNEYNETTYSLAKYLHLSPSAISRYTNGEMAPKIPTVDAIAKKFRISPAWLMGAEGVEKYSNQTYQNYKLIPILEITHIEQIISENYNTEIFEYVPSDSKIDLCLRVEGNSMSNAKINDGDIVYVQKQNDIENGEIAVVLIKNDGLLLRRVYKYSGTIILRPENHEYNELVFSKKDSSEIKIIGKCSMAKIKL